MKRLTATIVSALAVCMVMILCGCGGASSTNNIVAGQRGALKITVQWPVAPAAKSRLIPVLTNAIIVAVTTDDGTSVGGTTLTRPAAGVNTTSATLDQLPVGHVTVTATALANPDVNYAGNTPQAIGSVSATVVYNQTITTPDLVMNSTITKVGVTPSPVTAMAGGAPVVLTVSAMDKSGNVVMAPATNFTWASDNSAAATITRTGLTATLQGLKIGTAKITVTESDSKVVSAPVAVTVTGGTTSSGPNILIADTGNNRIVGLDAIPPATTLTYNDSGSGTAFGGVIGVAHDSSGRIYVADFYAKLIRIDDFTGKNRVAYAPS